MNFKIVGCSKARAVLFSFFSVLIIFSGFIMVVNMALVIIGGFVVAHYASIFIDPYFGRLNNKLMVICEFAIGISVVAMASYIFLNVWNMVCCNI